MVKSSYTVQLTLVVVAATGCLGSQDSTTNIIRKGVVRNNDNRRDYDPNLPEIGTIEFGRIPVGQWSAEKVVFVLAKTTSIAPVVEIAGGDGCSQQIIPAAGNCRKESGECVFGLSVTATLPFDLSACKAVVKAGGSQYLVSVIGAVVNSTTMTPLLPVEGTTSSTAFFNYQWGLHNTGATINYTSGGKPVALTATADVDMDAPEAWALLAAKGRSPDCTAVPVAILDTGIDGTHEDLANQLDTVKSKSFVDGGTGLTDVMGHGTHVAGIIGARGNNSKMIAGVCWKAKLISIKVLSDDGFTDDESLADAIEYVASSSGAKVANLSLGGYLFDDTVPMSVSEAVGKLRGAGILAVIAAGNGLQVGDESVGCKGRIAGQASAVFPQWKCGQGTDNDQAATAFYPAVLEKNFSNVITVAAIDPKGALATYSNFGANTVQIAAPGTGTLSLFSTTAVHSGYYFLDGTSMAAPFVTGTLALYWAQNTALNAAVVKRQLLESSVESEALRCTALNSRCIERGRVLNTHRLLQRALEE